MLFDEQKGTSLMRNPEFTIVVKRAIDAAKRRGRRCGVQTNTAQLLTTIINQADQAQQLLINFGLDMSLLARELGKVFTNSDSLPRTANLQHTSSFQLVINQAQEVARREGATIVSSRHLIEALAYQRPGLAGDILHRLGLPDHGTFTFKVADFELTPEE